MIRYVSRRVLMMIPVLIGVIFVVFCMMYFSPGEAADYMLGDLATAEDKALFNQQNGLDRPFMVQFVSYIGNLLKGDWGTSWINKRSVAEELMSRFPNTLLLATISMVIASALGITLGILSAVKQNSLLDSITRVFSTIGVSMPSFWEGLMLILLFSVTLRWLPVSGFTTWKHWILPAVTIGTASSATIMRMTRSSMLEAIRQDYIRTARAKGQKESVVIWKHALRNALIPVMTVIGLSFGKLLGGMAIIETVFAINGLGKLIVDAIPVKNTPVVQGGILLAALAMSVINLLTDIMYAFIDPRIRSQYASRRKSGRKQKTGEQG